MQSKSNDMPWNALASMNRQMRCHSNVTVDSKLVVCCCSPPPPPPPPSVGSCSERFVTSLLFALTDSCSVCVTTADDGVRLSTAEERRYRVNT